MKREEMLPSESEWLIMETLWDAGRDLTSVEICEKLPGQDKMSQRMVRVLINRLCKKNLISYTVDEKDSRVYHYLPIKTKEECRREKSIDFANNYFGGNKLGAAFAFLEAESLTEDQIKELEIIIKNAKKNK